MRQLRADVLLARNIEHLLNVRRIDKQALAMWCGHKPAWISKVLSGDRGVQLKDLGKIADFFGLTVAELFQHGISPLTERRTGQDRRTGDERRCGQERRQPHDQNRVHRDVHPFPKRKTG